jgi:hypothetical protein
VSTWQDERDELLAQGWRLAARGDWAWVYRSPDGARAARLSPFDPAYRLHLRACLAHAGNPYLPRVLSLRDLDHGGQLVVLPWLEASDELAAHELGARLGFPSAAAREQVGALRAQALQLQGEGDPALGQIRAILRRMVEDGERELPFFGGVDLRPANILRTAQGQLQLCDPIFVAGRELIAALQRDPEAVARRIAPPQLRAFLQIACFEAADDDPTFRALRMIVEALDGPV